MDDDMTEIWESMYSEGHNESPLDPMILEIAPTLPLGSSLDLGCGAGQNSIWLAERGWAATGVDLAPSAIGRATAAANELNVAASFVVADLAEWVPEGTFDFVASTYALPPAGPGRSHALATAAAAVKPGGTILVAEFDRTSLAHQDGWLSDLDVVDVDELASHLGGFDIAKLTVETTRHAHGHDVRSYPVALAIARRSN